MQLGHLLIRHPTMMTNVVVVGCLHIYTSDVGVSGEDMHIYVDISAAAQKEHQ